MAFEPGVQIAPRMPNSQPSRTASGRSWTASWRSSTWVTLMYTSTRPPACGCRKLLICAVHDSGSFGARALMSFRRRSALDLQRPTKSWRRYLGLPNRRWRSRRFGTGTRTAGSLPFPRSSRQTRPTKRTLPFSRAGGTFGCSTVPFRLGLKQLGRQSLGEPWQRRSAFPSSSPRRSIQRPTAHDGGNAAGRHLARTAAFPFCKRRASPGAASATSATWTANAVAARRRHERGIASQQAIWLPPLANWLVIRGEAHHVGRPRSQHYDDQEMTLRR